MQCESIALSLFNVAVRLAIPIIPIALSGLAIILVL